MLAEHDPEQPNERRLRDSDGIFSDRLRTASDEIEANLFGRVDFVESLHELEQLARNAGMRTMYEDGIVKALAGVTTIEEVLRVTEDV